MTHPTLIRTAVTLIVCMLVLPAQATIIIDDFETGPFEVTSFDRSFSFIQSGSPLITIGGRRSTGLGSQFPPSIVPNSIRLTTTPGDDFVEVDINNSESNTNILFTYDINNGRGVDLTQGGTQNGFSLSFPFSEGPIGMTIILRTDDITEPLSRRASSANFDLLGSLHNAVITVDFDAFQPGSVSDASITPADLTDIDQIIFILRTSEPGIYQISDFRTTKLIPEPTITEPTIPEPTSLTILGLSWLFFQAGCHGQRVKQVCL